MLQYRIVIPIDDEFGTSSSPYTGKLDPVVGITSIQGDIAQVDPNLLMDKPFFEPVKQIIKLGKSLKEISQKDLTKLMIDNLHLNKSEDGEYYEFDPNNIYDLKIAHKLDDIRIDLEYKNSPVKDFFLIDKGSYVDIFLSPFTKNYFTLSESEWCRFYFYLNKNLSLSQLRDARIDEVLGDVNPYKNLLRQLNFIVENGNSNRFFNSVLNFYREKGFISEKQANAIMKSIW